LPDSNQDKLAGGCFMQLHKVKQRIFLSGSN